MIKIALAQIDPILGDLKGNREKIENEIGKAKRLGADLIVFPEMAVCGYPPEDLLFKSHFVGDIAKSVGQIAAKAKGITVILGSVEARNGKLYNAAAVLEGGRIKVVYHKQFLPNYGVFDEKRYFAAGKKNPIFKIKGIDCAVSICEDVWEDVALKQAKAGAKLLINISSSPYDMGKIDERVKLLKDRAKKTKAHICYCNLVGGQDELVFDGSSMIIDPRGRLTAMAKEFEEDLLVADIWLARQQKRSANGRHIHKPSSRTARVFKALVLGVKDYVSKNGFSKAVVGLSGGIDSSLVAAIAVQALGRENVIGVTMPSRYTSEGTRYDAQKLAANLGIDFKEVVIEEIFEVYLKAMAGPFKGTKTDITEENLQARIRGNILMAFSNKFGWLVLTTGNKSEVAVGYCTLYGDMSGGFAVIKDVPKTLVYDICRHINSLMGPVIPESVFQRAPSAELRDNQTDQDSLPAYDELDAMIKDYVEEHKPFSKMSRGKDLEIVKKVINLIDRNEYKRRQAPPGIKITPRAFGKDWRLPITNKYKEF
jgi:NAD+ synthase (glutamine-hydrolysing)